MSTPAQPAPQPDPQQAPPQGQGPYPQPTATAAAPSPLALIGMILVAIVLVAKIFTPLLAPLIMYRGNVSADVVSLINLLISAGVGLLSAVALTFGIVALRSSGRPILAAIVVGAAGFSFIGVLLGVLSAALTALL